MIGFFDSGIGGLTVAKTFIDSYPNIDGLYLGDAARVPYGKRSFEELAEFTLQAAAWFYARSTDALVLACNTVSAHPFELIKVQLQKQYPDMPVIGIIEPTSQYIASQGFKNVAILSTESTKASGTYKSLLAEIAPQATVLPISCPGWESLVELEKIGTNQALELVVDVLGPHMSGLSEVDAVALCCTHYPFLLPELSKALPNMQFITQGECVLNAVKQKYSHLLEGGSGSFEAYTTGDIGSATRITSSYLGAAIQVIETELVCDAAGSPLSRG